MKEQDKDLEYFRKKAAKDYITTPLSVFIYIRELEKATKQMNSSNDRHNVRICCNVDCNDETTGKSPYCEFHASM